MQKYNWNYPTSIWAGENRIKDLSAACKQLNINKPLLVTDNGLAKSKIILNTLTMLKNEKFLPTFCLLVNLLILRFALSFHLLPY